MTEGATVPDVTTADQSVAGPIFIGGLSSSGKTQLRLALEAGGEIAMFRRSYVWPEVHGRHGDLSDPGSLDRCLRAMRRSSGDLPIPSGTTPPTVETYDELFAAFFAAAAADRGQVRWGLQSRGLEEFVPGIMRALPGSRYIHLVRDPRERISHMRSAGRRVSVGYEMAKWTSTTRRALDLCELLPQSCMVLRHEDLIANGAVARASVERFVALPLGAVPASVAESDGIVEMSSADTRRIEEHGRTEMERLGYEMRARRRGRTPSDLLFVAGVVGARVVDAVDRRRRSGT